MTPKPPNALRTTALAVVAGLLVASTAVVARPGILPDQPPAYGARERFAFDDAEAHLGVLVAKRTADGPSPAAGALVVVYKLERCGPRADSASDTGENASDAAPARTDRRDHRGAVCYQPIARAQTDDNGVAGFDLPEGFYGVKATLGDLGGRKLVKLDEDKRVRIHLGDGGHDRQQHGPFALGVRALMRTDDGPAPAAGADVVLEKYNGTRDEPRNGTWETVASGTTDDSGIWTTLQRHGIYRVTVTLEGLEGHQRLLLRHDTWVRVGLHAPAPGPGARAEIAEAPAADDAAGAE